MIDLSPDKTQLLDCDSPMLVLGGPGSGKTTIALLKAGRDFRRGILKTGQRILFLSFARATIARVEQQAGKVISRLERDRLEINTYHGFAWNLLRSHGYLIKGGNRIRLLPPPEAGYRFATFNGDAARETEKRRLFHDEGLLHFDLFAEISADLLARSQVLAAIICDAYPIVILDEFQDTNADEWRLIQQLGGHSRLIALADADQRIYEFRGASPKRIDEFIQVYSPRSFDFGSENHRSNGKDISAFGNDLLAEVNQGKVYRDVTVARYQVRKGNGLHCDLKLAVMASRQRLIAANRDNWSIAVLVPTRQLMLDVSTYLDGEQVFVKGGRLPPVSHEVALETAGPALAAVIIAGVLEGAATSTEVAHRLIIDLCNHLKGRKGNEQPSQQQLDLADAMGGFVSSGAVRGPKRKALADECMRIGTDRLAARLSGDPWEDWLTVRRLFETAMSDSLTQVCTDAKYLRLLHKGAMLRAKLGEIWRGNGSYRGAENAVRDALLQEHFAASTKEWRGVHVMTIHKSKGKEFDEVIIYEGSHQGRIARAKANDRELAQARLALRVGVTRARQRATILTPRSDPCQFL